MTSSSLAAVAHDAVGPPIPFDNSYARLPEAFYERVRPLRVAAPQLLRLNEALAQKLRIEPEFLKSSQGVEILAGNAIAPGSEPIALAYAGHQFGHFVPQLGDGRAVLLGEVLDVSGRRYDLQLKGSGPTRFSRLGDGRAALGPVLREYVVSEAMAALGIPTTRSLAAILSGESVMRERVLPGGVLTRVASSHLRVGTFQYFAARRDAENLRRLADYAIDRHYPEARDAENSYRAFFEAVVRGLADLVARWMQVGFIHGVLNTDNTSIAAETIDYGPCAFMDAYHPDKVFSSIDQFGRYAFSNQPVIIKWNLARLAETLLPFLASDEDKAIATANESLKAFDSLYQEAYAAGMGRKLGFARPRDGDQALIQDLLHRRLNTKRISRRRSGRCARHPLTPAVMRTFGRCSAILPPMMHGHRAGVRAWPRKTTRRNRAARACGRSIRLSSRAITASRRRSAMRRWAAMTLSMN